MERSRISQGAGPGLCGDLRCSCWFAVRTHQRDSIVSEQLKLVLGPELEIACCRCDSITFSCPSCHVVRKIREIRKLLVAHHTCKCRNVALVRARSLANV